MKTKLFSVMTAVLVLCSVTSAQNYSIQPRYNTNLRATASLQARIVETVAAGTTLPVVGNSNRWLQINRNGSEVWMADWVGYTRVESSDQPQSQSQIDNCCFVDRQCHTDEQWTNGYWAFQNNQCSAPAQSQPQSSAQPVSTAPSQIDNCCFVDRQCHTNEEWTSGYWAFQNNQCAAPAQSQLLTSAQHGMVAGVTIEGSPEYIAFVNETLDLLRTRSPKWYNYVISAVDRIFEDHDTLTGAAYTNSRLMGTRPYHRAIAIGDHEQNLLAMAAIIQHEACHIHRAAAGFPYNPYTKVSEEHACIQLEEELFDSIDPYNRSITRSVVGHAHCIGSLENHPLCERYKTPVPRHLIQCHYEDEERCEDVINWLTSPRT